jgi:hypothetical protein
MPRILPLVVIVLALAGCAAQPAVAPIGTTPAAGPSDVTVGPMFPAGAIVDYQLGGAYPPPAGVTVVERDNEDEPADGLYTICYINGFQTQPGAEWPADLLVHSADGSQLVDPNWPNEHILDLSTAEKRERIAELQYPVIDGCAAHGFAAVEFDNLDSYSRSNGAFALDDAVAFAKLIVAHAHAAGLPAGQKNTGELGVRGRDEIGFDFLVAEDCDVFEECADYTDVYGDRVIDIEYTDGIRRPFADVCADLATPASTILRDRGLSAAGEPGYVYEHC